MSAAVWCAELGRKPLLIEGNSKLGGQLFWTHNPVTNYLGSDAKNGTVLANIFVAHVERSDVEIELGRTITSVDLKNRTVSFDGGLSTARAIVIATGVRRRKLGIPGEVEFVGRGVLTSGAGERETVRDKTVAIVGGGDAALENALILSEFARRVYVVHRREKLSARAEFLDRVRHRSNVEF